MKKSLVALVALLATIPASVRAEGRQFLLIPVRVVELDGETMVVTGNGGWWLRENLAALIREELGNRRDIVIAVSGRQYDEIVATQDRVERSGRYRLSSRELLRPGQMVGPSEHFSASIRVQTDARSMGGGLVGLLTRDQADVSLKKVEANVSIVLEPIGVASGLHGRAIRVSGYASDVARVNIRLDWNRQGGFDNSSSNPEERLLARAAEKAVRDLIRRLSDGAATSFRLSLNPSRPIRAGDIIRRSADGRRFEVLAVSGEDLTVRELAPR